MRRVKEQFVHRADVPKVLDVAQTIARFMAEELNSPRQLTAPRVHPDYRSEFFLDFTRRIHVAKDGRTVTLYLEGGERFVISVRKTARRIKEVA